MERSNHRRSLAWWLDDDNHRNRFATGEGCGDHHHIVTLHGLGLMRRGRGSPGGLTYYHVTTEGITLAKREFKPRHGLQR